MGELDDIDICPDCGEVSKDDGLSWEAGDVWICTTCGLIQVFEVYKDGLSRRDPTPEEEKKIAQVPTIQKVLGDIKARSQH